jgi:Fur family ferric uptake transcriptional regulator
MGNINAQMINNERARFLGYLAQAGLRASQGRELVFSEVMGTHGHFTAEELAKACFRT